ncbi:hypothetical protein GIB67_022688 [Kingdonia uniflora]|uniref:DNA-directed RNA polymerase II protein n=1 Tax=Kingdonia uniflora TaxID=39325 RepID=A0A7J7P8D2_9MAGN|nr:hypothetical protein GIB67_022688 [Kingdonia uniflora]
MARRVSNCAICESSNRPSICAVCVNYRLNDYTLSLKSLKGIRDSLYLRLSAELVSKSKADDQHSWQVLQKEKLARLREKLKITRDKVSQGKTNIDKISSDLKARYELVESAMLMLEKNRVEQLEKFYPNLIYTQSLGHMAITSERLHKQSLVIKQIFKLFPQRKVAARVTPITIKVEACSQGLKRPLDSDGEITANTKMYSLAKKTLLPIPNALNKCSICYIAYAFRNRKIARTGWSGHATVTVNLDAEKKDGSTGQYDQICNARVPRGLDPHSVPSEELAASLGYMVQLLNLVVQSLAVPALHNSGFAGSCSRIWQRDSYWDARPSSRSNEYPLFIPRQNCCTTSGENSWSDRSSSNFGIASVESEKKAYLDAAGSSSFKYSSASPHSVETHKDLQKGISLLKKSVACITAYCYNSLCLDVPSETSTFEAFAKLLATLSSSKEVRSVFSLKTAYSRSYKQVQQMNKSVWNVNSSVSSSSLLESAHRTPTMRNACDNNLSTSASSFFYTNEVSDIGKSESLVEGWDIVEHPTFPPPPSQTEDIEHWTRAMFVDATKR